MASHPIQKTGHLYGYLAQQQPIRASVVDMTELVEAVCAMQGTTVSSSVALGRSLVGTVLVASMMKERQALSFQFMGSGPLARIFTHAQSDGICRGTLSLKQAPLSFGENGISLQSLIGEGLLQVTTFVPEQKSPQVSQVPLVSSEIGEDIAFYLSQSLQIPCLINIGVRVNGDGKVVAAGGVLVELMPGHSLQLIQELEAQQEKMVPLSTLMEGGETPLSLLHNCIGGQHEMKLVKDHSVQYACTCSREKAAQSLHLLEPRDFEEILSSPESLNVDCEMCGLTQRFNQEEVQAIYLSSGKAPLH